MNQMVKLIDDIASPEGYSSIYTYNDIQVPRTTEILNKCIHSDQLMYWANSLGFKHQSYNKTIKLAADIGSQCHETIDSFLDNNGDFETPSNMMQSSRFAYESFLKWWNTINAFNKVEVIYHEKKLACKYFGGTLDGLYSINGKIYLVDYKTSNHITYKYCLQLASYRYMLREEYGINIDGCIILQLSKNDISYNEYVLNLDDLNHLNFINDCEQAFLSLVYAFYNICSIESKYNNINWGCTG